MGCESALGDWLGVVHRASSLHIARVTNNKEGKKKRKKVLFLMVCCWPLRMNNADDGRNVKMCEIKKMIYLQPYFHYAA